MRKTSPKRHDDLGGAQVLARLEVPFDSVSVSRSWRTLSVRTRGVTLSAIQAAKRSAMRRTMTNGISFASVKHANHHPIVDSDVWHRRPIDASHSDRVPNCNANTCLLVELFSVRWSDAPHTVVDRTESIATPRMPSKPTGAIARGAVAGRSR
jgi:hypothetical protein